MIDIQHIDQPPKDFHYLWRRTAGSASTEGELTAQDYLRQQGCTLILHCSDGISYGVIEHRDVVQQRIRQPRHD